MHEQYFEPILTTVPVLLQPLLWGLWGHWESAFWGGGSWGGIPGKKPYSRARCAAMQEHPPLGRLLWAQPTGTYIHTSTHILAHRGHQGSLLIPHPPHTPLVACTMNHLLGVCVVFCPCPCGE